MPLAGSDPDAIPDLHVILAAVYGRTGLDYALSYTVTVDPRLPEGDAEWCRGILSPTPGIAPAE